MFFSKKSQTRNHRLVMVFGQFTDLHAGTEFFLKEARRHGDELIAVVARDATIQSITNREPKISEKNRVQNLKNSKLVDKAILGDYQDKYSAIKKYRPDVIALGFNQFVFTQLIEKTLITASINAEIIRLTAYLPQVQRSQLLKNNANEETQTTELRIEAQPLVGTNSRV